jgi:subtilisin family serine protease
MLLAHLTPARAGPPDWVGNQLIARFSSPTAAAHAPTAVDHAGGRVMRRLRSIDAVVVRPRSHVALDVLRQALERRNDVRYVERDVILRKSTTTYPTSGYKVLSGTSMAAPFVIAAAAMLRAEDSRLSSTQIRQRLLAPSTACRRSRAGPPPAAGWTSIA